MRRLNKRLTQQRQIPTPPTKKLDPWRRLTRLRKSDRAEIGGCR
jgi:hypothetical protein